MFPLPLLGLDRFAALRSLFEKSDFNEAEICRGAGVPRLCDLPAPGEGREVLPLDSGRAVLTRLLLDREPVPFSAVRRELGDSGAALLEEFHLLRPDPEDSATCFGTVMLYPAHGLYIASDRDWEPETGRGVIPRADAVYLSITPNAYDFLQALPSSPCEDFLDMCSGSGFAGIGAAHRYAKHATACDIAERCSRFAEWNARLNGAGNLTALTGDLYQPVAGRMFDRIVAHPPFVPSSDIQYVFRDAGADGEQITRGIINGLPTFLRPGGCFYLTASITERRGSPLEHRLREMLGPANEEFDVFAAIRRQASPEDFFSRSEDKLKACVDQAKEQGIESFAYCSIAIQRRASDRPVFTIRKNLPAAHGPMIEWLMRWEALRREAGFEQRFLRERIRAAPGIRLRVVHSLDAGKWKAQDSRLMTDRPFPSEAECLPWVSALIDLCEKRPTVREALEALKARNAVPPQAPAAEFTRLVQSMISAGVLELESLRLPSENNS